MTKVFVYGTLREGERSHDLLRGAEKVADARLPGYDMYKVGWFPGIKPNPDNKEGVVGEIYEVDDRTLETLDCYEGYSGSPASLFMRRRTHAEGVGDVLVYEYNRDVGFKFCEPVPSGDWKQK